MKVLVAGGLGYIGSTTAVALLNHGHEVVIVDNLYNAEESVKDKIEMLTGKKVALYIEDCANALAMARIFSEHAVDCVIHFAGYKAVGESVEEPLKYYRNNLDTAMTVLEEMKKHDVHTFVFSSSATVYAPEHESPLTEGLSLGAVNPYGWTKVMIEQMMRDVVRADASFSGIALRYFNPIGAEETGLLGEKPDRKSVV